jgi:uncharacterized protein involved in exopolysaccharide biosynthesis
MGIQNYTIEEEIDLRAYAKVLIRHWKWIVVCALAAALAAFVVSALRPPIYEAEATVAIIRSRTDVIFAPQMVTTEDKLTHYLDKDARRTALVALASSSDIASQVLDEIGARLELGELTVPGLLGMIEASNEGDLISIKARHRDPIAVTTIANAWARQYERYVNDLFGAAGESGVTVAAQVGSAEATYNAAQAALEAFLGDNRIATLEREIAARQELLDAYQSARNAAQINPVNLQITTTHKILADYYADLQKVERWQADARALRTQIEAGSGSAAANTGDALALILLRSQALGGSEGLPVQLQVDLITEPEETVRLADVDALINVLEARRVETQEQIDVLTAALAAERPNEITIEIDNPLNLRIAELDVEILALQKELEAQNAQKQELDQARDLAWGTFQTLAQKQAEVEIASQVTGTEVRLAASAMPPGKRVSSRKMLNTAVAGMMGLMVGVFVVFALEWWRGAEK